MANDQSSWRPDWALPPGDILLEALEERQLSQAELARRMDRPLKTINEIVKGKAAVTPTTAIQLERALGISADLWVGLESQYRKALARAQDLAELESEAEFIKKFPIRDLVRRGALPSGLSRPETLGQLLALFGVSSTKAWRQQWEVAPALREAPAFKSSVESLATWVRLGQLQAEQQHAGPFQPEEFQALLQEVRRWTRQTPLKTVFEKVRRSCGEVGVVVVIIPELSGTSVSGAAYRLGKNKRVIQLSGRYKRDDQLWFTFFHEAAHILFGSDRLVIDDVDREPTSVVEAEDEVRADQFARETLLTESTLRSFLETHPKLTPEVVREFARREQVAPGIVVGRLQRDNYLPKSVLNDLKRKVDLSG